MQRPFKDHMTIGCLVFFMTGTVDVIEQWIWIQNLFWFSNTAQGFLNKRCFSSKCLSLVAVGKILNYQSACSKYWPEASAFVVAAFQTFACSSGIF